MKTLKLSLVLLFTMLVYGLPGWAGDRQVYGWELMTEQERIDHRNKMRSFKTRQEREEYRIAHHKKMQARAKKKGLVLPDEPQERGKGMGGGPGGGRGPGAGSR